MRDRCPGCNHLLIGDTSIVVCDICGVTCLGDPDHAPTTPPEATGNVYAWTGERWLLVVNAEWLPW